jgi:hypothetical protein
MGNDRDIQPDRQFLEKGSSIKTGVVTGIRVGPPEAWIYPHGTAKHGKRRNEFNLWSQNNDRTSAK